MPAASKSSTRITLPSDREVAMSRDFDAPRALVFDACTKPELVKRWFGAPGWSLDVCEIDLRVGGAWRYVMSKAGGIEITLRGVYRELLRPERIVNTQSMEGCEGQGDAEALCTMTLTERTGRTTMFSTTRYPSKEVRDSVLKHGTTEESMDIIFDKLAALLSETSSKGLHS